MLLTRPAINVPESRNSVLKGSLEILSQAKNDMDASASSRLLTVILNGMVSIIDSVQSEDGEYSNE